ncbi:MAG: helix-turn-helix domain-containing protein, partial [Eubacterium sp.]|nr:helix-turn-helix domain-containing protein [Eubacterium sp.]
KDYRLTMEKFNVTYQQIYLWVKKYEEKGIDGLVDRRGKAKPEAEISEIDRLKAQNKMLESEKMRLEMEVNVLKKLAEIERRRH